MKKIWKRSTAFMLALVMCLSVAPVMRIHAADNPDTFWYDPTNFEPYAHGYRYVDILNWDPATDPYAEEMVAKVPLQKRNPTFSATQANPDLIDDARLYLISTAQYRDTGKNAGPWHGNASYDNFGEFVFKFWQYTDMVGGGGRPTANIVVGSDNLEYGTITVPVAAATNAAHKNGVLSIAEYFVPRTPQYTEEWLYKDENGNFPYAQKLVELANYYGFDGYFINQEEAISAEYVPLFRDMLKWMREQGLYIQWYDSIGDGGTVSYRNKFDDYNDGWIWNAKNGRVCDSIFLNYWYDSTALMDSHNHARELGLDPYEAVYMGYEGNQWKFSRELDSYHNVVGLDDQPYTSFAVWGAQWYHEDFNRANNMRYTPGYQWESDERERIFFTSPDEIAGRYRSGSVRRDDISYDQPLKFKGFSRYIVEKSVINGTCFATDFNTGRGMQYFTNGAVSRDMQWSNLNLQDILPTWQWWIQGDSITLDMDWDYGSTYYRLNSAGEKYPFPYTQIGGYNGGNSLAIYGNLQNSQKINLYKTALDVVDGSELALTYNKPSADDTSVMQAALIFEDDPQNPVYLPIADSGKKTTGWTTAVLPLSDYAGRTIAAIGLELSSAEAVENYQVNIGRLAVTDGTSYTPAAPTGVTLAKRFDKFNDIQLKWDLDGYENVVLYRIYANYKDGTSRFVGGAYSDNYYIQTLENPENVTGLEVRAVGIDGTESEGTRVALASDNRVSGIAAVSADNKLTVTWTDPAEDFTSVEAALNYWYSNKENPAAVTVTKGTQTAQLDVPLEDGEKYVLSLTTINADGSRNETVNYFGELSDHYCDPYDGSARLRGDGNYNLTTPAKNDWASMEISIDGQAKTYERFGKGLNNIAVPQSGLSTMVLTVTDMDGNVSEPVTKIFVDGREIAPDSEFAPSLFPDPVLLSAVQTKVGKTLNDLFTFKGPLDLSGEAITNLTGLKIISGITELDLTGTAITELTPDVVAPSIEKITLSDCSSLKKVSLNDYSATSLTLGKLPVLEELELNGYGNFDLNLTGAPALYSLYLARTARTSLDISANLKLHNFVISDSMIDTLTAADAASYTSAYRWNWSNARMDLSAGTGEGKLMEGLKTLFASSELPDEVAAEKTTLAKGGAWKNYQGNTKVIDLKNVAYLSELTFTNSNYDSYGASHSLKSAHIAVSTDGNDYTDVMDFESNGRASSVTITLPKAEKCRYVKLTTSQSGKYVTSNWTCLGYSVAPKGLLYGGQKPAVARDIRVLEVPVDNAEYQVLDLLKESYASAKTALHGTALSDLKGADWIDAAYLEKEGTMPGFVKAVITDSEGAEYVYNDTNGLIKADTAETYDVVFKYFADELGKTQVIVRALTVEEVQDLISAISSPITPDSKPAIDAARQAYNNLPKEQQDQVNNYAVLEQAEADYRKLAEKVEQLIDEIGFVTLERKDAIDAARNAYNALPEDLQALVENYKTLQQAEQQYAYLTEAEALKNAAEAAKTAAKNAQAQAEAAQQAAEEAQSAAEQAAAQTALDKTAAEQARQEAESAKTAAEEAKAKAEAARTAAEEARAAAESANTEAAKKAQAAAEEAARAAEESAAAAASAREAAEAQRAAQDARTAAEEAARTAEDAKVKAEAAKKAADEAASSAAEDKTNAEKAKKEAQDAQKAAEDAMRAAQDAQESAEKAKQEADASNKEAAESAALAAKYAREIAEARAEIVAIKAELIDYLAKAQQAAEDAEEARKAALEAQKKAEEAALASAKYYALIQLSKINLDELTPEQREMAEAVIADAQEKIDKAVTIVYTEDILKDVSSQMERIRAWKCACDTFTDVKDAWYHAGVDYMFNNHYMYGLTGTEFGVYQPLSRAQLVAILYRIAGKPDVTGLEHPFTDVPENIYYSDAVTWAYNEGLVFGTTKTTFSPNDNITRLQLVKILYRYDGEHRVEEYHLAAYADAAAVPAYARDAMNWAVSAGLINGVKSGNTLLLAPRQDAQRAQIAAILADYLTR